MARKAIKHSDNFVEVWDRNHYWVGIALGGHAIIGHTVFFDPGTCADKTIDRESEYFLFEPASPTHSSDPEP